MNDVKPPTPPTSSPPALRPATATSSNRYRSSPRPSRSPSPSTRASSTSSSSTNSSPRKTSSASVILRTSVVDKVYLDKGYQFEKPPATPTSSGDSEPSKKRFSGVDGITTTKKRSGASASLTSIGSFRRNSNPFGNDLVNSSTSMSTQSSGRRTSTSSASSASPPASECRGSPDGCGLQVRVLKILQQRKILILNKVGQNV